MNKPRHELNGQLCRCRHFYPAHVVEGDHVDAVAHSLVDVGRVRWWRGRRGKKGEWGSPALARELFTLVEMYPLFFIGSLRLPSVN